MYNVYGSQNEFVDSVTRVFILRMRSLGQNGPLRRDAVFAVARIWGTLSDERYHIHHTYRVTTWSTHFATQLRMSGNVPWKEDV